MAQLDRTHHATVGNHKNKDIIFQIHADHRQILRLLPLFEREAHALESAQKVDYELIHDLLDFFTGPLDHAHHVKENLIYNWIKTEFPGQVELLFDIDAEHAALAKHLERLKHKIDAVMNDYDVPRADVASHLRDFARVQKRHLTSEELTFLPLADLLLSPEDRLALTEKGNAAGHASDHLPAVFDVANEHAKEERQARN